MRLPAEPVRVAADEELVERMLQPILDNAVRYGRSPVEVSLERNGSLASVHVADDGRCRRRRARAASSSPARGEAARNREGGAGLGLSLRGGSLVARG
jgi:K+-sensing histidine kinase KdpD